MKVFMMGLAVFACSASPWAYAKTYVCDPLVNDKQETMNDGRSYSVIIEGGEVFVAYLAGPKDAWPGETIRSKMIPSGSDERGARTWDKSGMMVSVLETKLGPQVRLTRLGHVADCK